MNTIRLDKRKDGVAVLTFDNPDGKVNILSRGLFDEIREILDDVGADPSVKACVLCSGKPDNFIAGANLKEFLAMEKPEEGESLSREGHELLARIARSKKPVVAAIAGLTLGGGLEVALACRYRLAADDPKTILALPEVQLGLLPGGGGTQRLPRLIGLPAALPLLLTGKRVRAKKAYRMGLVDALTSPGGIVETAAKAALRLAEGKLKPRRRKKPILERFLESPFGRTIVFKKAAQQVQRQARGNYPAPTYILDCVRTGYDKGFGAGRERESVLFGKLCASPEAKSLIGLFQAMTDLKKAPDDTEPLPVKRLAVLGAGFMGSDIAAVSLPLAPVVMRDISDDALSRGVRHVYLGLGKRVKSRAINSFERDRLMARLRPTLKAEDLSKANLIIEAVFEDLKLKHRVLAEVEEQISPEAVFASNTSALPIGEIASEAKHPERILGMHYFSPVPKMPLLELIVAEKTAPWAVATAREFAVKQGKTVIIVKDGPGFYTTRILSPYLNEAMVLLEEGAAVDEVDRALKDFGYPVGPVTLLDEVGIDVGAHVVREFGQLYTDRGLGASSALPKLFEAGYEGRKNRKGFYQYPKKRRKGPKQVNPEVYSLFGGPNRKPMSRKVIAERMGFLMVNEAAYCLQEGILSCPRDGDVGAILGLGFPPFRGGPFRYLDTLGAEDAVAALEGLAEKHGERFLPAPILKEMAEEDRKFYAG